MIVEFDDDALEEYHLAARYAAENFGLGDRFVKIMETAIQGICADPSRFKTIAGRLHLVHLPHVPYNVIYQHLPGSEVIKIYAVAHRHRKPDYWRSRL